MNTTTTTTNVVTVEDYFKTERVTLEFIEKVYFKFSNAYWGSAFEFVKKVWEKNMAHLTHSQRMWLSKILEDCVELRIEKKVI